VTKRPAAWFETAVAWPLLWALVFSIPWEKSLMVAGVGTITRLVGVLAVLAGIAAVIQRRALRRPNLVLMLAAAFVAWNALTLLWSYAPAATAAKALTLGQLLVMVWLIWELCGTASRETALMAAYVAGAAVSSVLTILRFEQGLQTYYRRYAATGFEPNDLGLTVALSIPLALHLSMRGRGPLRWLWRCAVALAIAAILLSASRTALVVSLAGFAYPLWTWRKSDLWQKLSCLVLLSLLLLGPLYLAPVSSRQRLATRLAEDTTWTLHSRTQIWKSGLRVLLFERPLLGVGAGAYPEAVRPRLGTPAIAGHQYVAHNTYLSVLVESGLIGFGLFSLTILALGAFVWMMPAAERALWTVMLLVCGVGVLTLTWEHRKPVWLIAALIMTAWARSFRLEGEPR
jgi:O-antigen ligase